MRISVKELTGALKGDLILGHPKTEALRVCLDSRQIQPGDVFFALKGERVDGHDFAGVACREGAAAVVVQNLDWFNDFSPMKTSVIRVPHPEKALKNLGKHLRKKFKGPVVGITGSNGKTTTKQMLASILSVSEPGLFTRGNFNSQLGLPIVLSEIEDQHKWMVLEMGASEPGNLTVLSSIGKPTVAILTGLGPAHLASFGSMERLAEAKWELMDNLPPAGTAVIPWGEPLLEKHIRSFKRKLMFFGDDPSCPVRATNVEAGESVTFSLHLGPDKRQIRLPVPGRFNVRNALAAAGAAWVLGRSLDDIEKGLAQFKPPAMRMEVKRDSSGAVFINDAYNANPASMLQSVRSVVETYPTRKKIFVLGSMLEMGPESDRWHFHIGTELSHFDLDKVILVGKEMEAAMNGLVSSKADKNVFSWVSTAEEAIPFLKKQVKGDSVVLLKGSRGVALEKILDSFDLSALEREKENALPSL